MDCLCRCRVVAAGVPAASGPIPATTEPAAHTGDTAWTDDIIAVSAEADLLVAEA